MYKCAICHLFASGLARVRWRPLNQACINKCYILMFQHFDKCFIYEQKINASFSHSKTSLNASFIIKCYHQFASRVAGPFTKPVPLGGTQPQPLPTHI